MLAGSLFGAIQAGVEAANVRFAGFGVKTGVTRGLHDMQFFGNRSTGKGVGNVEPVKLEIHGVGEGGEERG